MVKKGGFTLPPVLPERNMFLKKSKMPMKTSFYCPYREPRFYSCITQQTSKFLQRKKDGATSGVSLSITRDILNRYRILPHACVTMLVRDSS